MIHSSIWRPIENELRQWRADGLSLALWWRDDDAVDTTQALTRLLNLRDDLELCLHLSIVPRNATKGLAQVVANVPDIVPMVHGWAHVNHAMAGEGRSEFPEARDPELALSEAQEGLRLLTRLTDGHCAPVFVPPWNNIAPDLADRLSSVGYDTISACNPRQSAHLASGIAVINTHLDPIHWREGERLHDLDYLIDTILKNLRERRKGRYDNTEPFGLLTHHLSHNEDVWEFIRQFFDVMTNAGAKVVNIRQNSPQSSL